MKFWFSLNLVVFLIFKQARAQNFKDLDLNSISSIDWKSFDYKQLKPFVHILKEKDMLVLSEGNHGDGSSHEVQCMILKGLIDSCKIKTIYTESSWMIIDKINQILRLEGKDGIKKCIGYMQSSELRYWADNGFWDYLAGKIIEKKVRLEGFDVGASEAVVLELLEEALLLKRVQEYKVRNEESFKDALSSYRNFDGWSIMSMYFEESYNKQQEFIGQILLDYKEKGDWHRMKQWQTILNFFYWMQKRARVMVNNKLMNIPENDKQKSAFMSIRDSLMADHFLNTYDSSDKSVMLVSAYHGIQNSNYIDGLTECCKDPSVYIMGDIIKKKLGDKIYNVRIINATGSMGITYYYERPVQYKYKKPVKGSLEYHLWKNTTGDYYFVDLQNPSIKYINFSMRGFYEYFFNSRWSTNFSGVFFVRDMKPLIFKNPDVISESVDVKNAESNQ